MTYDLDRLVYSREESIQRYLTPSKEEQTALVLAGKCPHNKGWRYDGHSHNSEAYECVLCRETKYW
jgi:hypothetical protein